MNLDKQIMLITRLAVLAVLAVGATHAQTPRGPNPGYGQITVGKDVHHDRSKPLRQIQPAPPSKSSSHVTLPVPSGQARTANDSTDLALARPELVNGGPGVATTLGLNRAGLGLYFSGPQGSFTPATNRSDATGAIGTTQYLQWVDDSLAIFDKVSGNVTYGPAAGNAIWTGFGGPCEVDNDGQPTVNFDKLANRWVVSQYAISSGAPYLQCVAVSTSADATGAWNRYSFQIGGGAITDGIASPNWINKNARLGVWPDGYYMSFDMYNGTTFMGDKLCAVQRQNMLTGAGAPIQCIQMDTDYFGIVVGDLDSATPPPSGAPAYFAADDTYVYAIDIWKLHIDWADFQNSTISLPIPLAATIIPSCNPVSFIGLCVPQPGTTDLIDAYGGRLTGRMPYRNYGDHQALFAAETDGVAATPSAGPAAATAVHFYEMRISGSGHVSMYQHATFAPDTNNFRFIPSIAADRVGNIAVAYNLSSTQTYPSQFVSTRAATDPLGTLGNETYLNPGNASQTATTLWNTRSSLTVDPVDDCTYWYNQQYIPFAGSTQWVTQIAAFTLAGCQATTVTVQTSPANLQVALNSGAYTPAPVSGQFTAGSTIQLSTGASQSGTPGTAYIFQNWSDGGAATHNITVPAANTTYTANFATAYALTTAVSPAGAGTVAPTNVAYITAGNAANLVATPAPGYQFSGWTGNVANKTSASTTITMNAPQSVTANFTPLPAVVHATLTSKTGPTSSRTWTFTFTNSGGPGTSVTINSLKLTQTAGTACTPVTLTSLPEVGGNISPNGTIIGKVLINFSSCRTDAKFTVIMPYSVTGGASHTLNWVNVTQ